MLLPFFPEEKTYINSFISFIKKDGDVWYYIDDIPSFHHKEDDYNSFKMYVSQLYVYGNVKQKDIVQVFGINPRGLKRWVKKYREGGVESFYTKPTPRRATVLTEDKLNEIQDYLDNGFDLSSISEMVNVKKCTISKAIQKGKLRKKKL